MATYYTMFDVDAATVTIVPMTSDAVQSYVMDTTT